MSARNWLTMVDVRGRRGRSSHMLLFACKLLNKNAARLETGSLLLLLLYFDGCTVHKVVTFGTGSARVTARCTS